MRHRRNPGTGPLETQPQTVFVCVTVDTECDRDAYWGVRRPIRFRGVYEGITETLQPVFDDFGVRPTYLLSPEVILDPRSVQSLRNLGDRVELGTHLHGEFIEPEAQMDAEVTLQMQSSLPLTGEKEKIENLTGLFEKTFGYRPLSFRAGRFGLSRHTLSILEELGYRVDTSVVPLHGEADPGGSVSFLSAPFKAYFPSSDDFCRPGGLSVLELPVTAGMSIWSEIPSALRPCVMKSRILRSLLCRMVGRRRCVPVWLRPTRRSAEEMMNLSTWWVERNPKERAVILVMMFHNIEAVPGCSPYVHTEGDAREFIGSLRTYLGRALERNWRFATLSEAASYHRERGAVDR